MNDVKGNPASNPKTVTHTRYGKGKDTDTSNVYWQQKLLSNRTLLVVVPKMNPRIDNRISPIGGAYQTLLTPATKEVVTGVVHRGTWVNWTQGQVIQIVRGGSTPGSTSIDVRFSPAPSPVLIVSPTISPSYGISGSLQVGKKQQSTYPDKVRNVPKLDTVVDGNFPDDQYSASIFIKVIGSEISHGSRDGLYLRFRMDFLSCAFQTKAPQLVDFGFPTTNKYNELGVLGTPTTRIQRPTYGSHWTVSDHVFGESTAVGIIVANS